MKAWIGAMLFFPAGWYSALAFYVPPDQAPRAAPTVHACAHYTAIGQPWRCV